jgi:LAO/AO transport system kinase
LRRREEDPPGFPKALLVSAQTGAGLVEAWAEMQTLADWRRAEGHFERRRAGQARRWFEEEVRQGLLARLKSDPALRARMAELGAAVEAGRAAPTAAAAEVLERIARWAPE